MANDPYDDMPKIRLEKDDLESFHRTRAQATNKSSKKGNVPDELPSASNSPSWFVIFFLLIIIVGAAGYWSFEQYKVLLEAQSRISELESRLSATGEDMDQSAAALQIKVSELSAMTDDLWAQMDKLWASAWRRNQSEISTLKNTLKAQKAFTEKTTKTLSSEASNNDTNIGLVKEQLENQADLLKQLNEKFSQTNNVDADFEQQLASLREKLIATALGNNDLTNQIDDLRRKLLMTDKKLNEFKTLPVPIITPVL
jgi:DNA repair exonuclease SbcCD ATPase subunit